jgi:SAM-dependent methyltransferase
VINVVTAVRKAELARARVLATTLPDTAEYRCTALLLDDPDGVVAEAAEPFGIVRPEDLGLPGAAPVAGKTSEELRDGLRPWLLRHVLPDADAAVYVDRSAVVLAPLDAIVTASEGYTALAAEIRPGDKSSFVIAAATAREGLDAWLLEGAEPRRRELDPAELDGFVVAFGSREPGDPPPEDPVLAAAWEEYAERLLERGHARLRDLLDATALAGSRAAAGLYVRELLGEAATHGVTGLADGAVLTDEFLAWVRKPAGLGGGGGVNRFLDTCWRRRPDLRAAFPDLAGRDGARLIEWAWRHGTETEGLPAELLPPRDPDAPDPDALSDGTPALAAIGVNVVGLLGAELGLGEAARNVIAGLDAAGVPLLPVETATQGVSPRASGPVTTVPASAAAFGVNLLCLNGPELDDFAAGVDEEFFAGRPTVGLLFWEGTMLPEQWRVGLTRLDEIWVASEFVAANVRAATDVPVRVVPLPVPVGPVGRFDREDHGISADDTVFLVVFDHSSTVARKNPLGAMEAFARAFGPADRAALLIKSINASRDLPGAERVRLAASHYPRITVVEDLLPLHEKNAMVADCDCYVSLHRSEGFGLTLAEAMLRGKPVIATRYGGNLEFMDEDTGYLVDHTLGPVGPGSPPYQPDDTWAEPDLDQAAAFMQMFAADPRAGAQVGERAAASVARRFGVAPAGDVLRVELQRVAARRSTQPPPVPATLAALASVLAADRRRAADLESHAAALARLEEKVDVNAALANPAVVDDLTLRARAARQRAMADGARGARGYVRRAVLRGLRPYTAHADEVDDAVIEALDRLGGGGAGRSRSPGPSDRDNEPIVAKLQTLDRKLWGWEHFRAQLSAAPYMDPPFDTWREPGAGRVFGYRDAAVGGGLVDVFRGPEERVRELVRPYVELLRGHEPVLDIGCGRGELLGLLRDEGVAARGAELDAAVVERCRAAGLDVVQDDAVVALEAAAPASLGAVTAIHVLEHLAYAEMTGLLAAARAALCAGGLLVAETVNPHEPMAARGFAVDPTHRQILWPETLLVLCREAGFPTAYVFHPGGTGDAEADRSRAPVYAVVARA